MPKTESKITVKRADGRVEIPDSKLKPVGPARPARKRRRKWRDRNLASAEQIYGEFDRAMERKGDDWGS